MLDSLDTLIAFALIMTVVSLLITIVVQMISTALNLRGRNLAKAMLQILQTTDPNAPEEIRKAAERLTGYLLTRPHLSDHAFFGLFPGREDSSEADFKKADYKLPTVFLNRFATAIRPQEVFDTLVQLAKRSDPENKTLAREARLVLDRMGISFTAADRATIDSTVQSLQEAQEHLRKIPEGEKLVAAIEKSRQSVIDGIKQTEIAVGAAWERFNFWFEATQDRAQQWFAMHTRCWTIVFALIFAFVLELDTIEIYRTVSTDRPLRETLVANATAVLEQSKKSLGDSAPIISEAFDAWRKRQTNQTVAPLLAGIKPDDTVTRGVFLRQLQSALAAQPKGANLLADFNKSLDETIQQRLNELGANVSKLRGTLEASGFPLLVPGGRWPSESRPWCPGGLHFWGMLMTSGLLALGAPFWFNTLKGLSNLRSMVARDISNEEQSKNKAANQANAAPSTTTLPPLNVGPR